MSELAMVAVIAAVVAGLAAVMFVLSVRAHIATGPQWAAVIVLAVLGGGWATTWFFAQAAPAGTGWVATSAVTFMIVTAILGGGPVATAALRLADTRREVPDGPVPDGTAAPVGPAGTDVLRSGAVIGILERAVVVALLFEGFPDGIAFLLGIKGLGRFGEIKDRAEATERFIVGTLASVLWAVMGVAAARALLS